MSVTLRWNTLRCYNSSCQHIPLYRCKHYHKCGHEGCAEHLPLVQTGDGKMYLCGECRLLRAMFLNEVHLIGLEEKDLEDLAN